MPPRLRRSSLLSGMEGGGAERTRVFGSAVRHQVEMSGAWCMQLEREECCGKYVTLGIEGDGGTAVVD